MHLLLVVSIVIQEYRRLTSAKLVL